MKIYKQPRESLAVLANTLDYRLFANMHLVPDTTTADLLNTEKKNFIPLTDVRLFSPGHDDPPDPKTALGRTPFFGLNRKSTLWVAGGRAPVLPELTHKEVKVAMIFHHTMLAGIIKIPITARMTDHFDTSRSFQTMYNARLYPMAEGQSLSEIKAAARFDFVVVNAHLATGVIEG